MREFITAPLTPENFTAVTAPDGSEVQVPAEIFINNINGSRHPGTFLFDPLEGTAIEKSAHVSPEATLDGRVVVGARSDVGANSHLSQDVRVGDDSRISDKVRLGARTVIAHHVRIDRKVYIGRGSRIHAYAHIGNRVEIGEFSLIGEHVQVDPRLELPPHSKIAPGSQKLNVDYRMSSPYFHERRGA